MYTTTVTSTIHFLGQLRGILEKTKTWQSEMKITDDALMNSRLILDQFPLAKQVQLVSDYAKRGGAVLCGIEAPKFEDNEKNLDELIARIDKTTDFLTTLTPDMEKDDLDTRLVPIVWMPGKGLLARFDIETYSKANFFFHLVTSYSILRHYGVQIGKADYMGMPEFKNLA